MLFDLSTQIFELTFLCGITAWMTIVFMNNVTAFGSGLAFVRAIMTMETFRQTNTITPLLRKSLTSRWLHLAAFVGVLLFELIAALSLLLALALQLLSFAHPELSPIALTATIIALNTFLLLALVFLLGGSWFAYYVHRDVTQLTHFAMIITAAIGVALFQPTLA